MGWRRGVIVLSLVGSMVSCAPDTGYVKMTFTLGTHAKRQDLDFGTYTHPRLVFADHDVAVRGEFRQSAELDKLDEARAKRLEDGDEKVMVDVIIQVAPLNEERPGQVQAVAFDRVEARQGGETIACTPSPTTAKTKGRAPVEPDAGRVPARGGGWTTRRTKPVNYRCELARRPFELVLSLSLEGGNDEPRTVRVPMEPGSFEFRTLNATLAGCTNA